MKPSAAIIIACLVVIPVGGMAQQRSAENLFWPKPPDKPRIQFLYAFCGKQDMGIEKSFWRKLADVVFGEEREINSMARPQGIAVDSKGCIYVTDIALKGVHVFDFEEKEHTLFQGDDDHQFVSPVGIAVSPDGMLYVSDSEIGAVLVFDPDGDYKFTISKGLKRPTGICLSSGALYVADTGLNRVVVFDEAGNERYRIGKRGLDDTEFNFPIDVHAEDSSDNNLYVVDAMNFRIQVLRREGTLVSKFGKLGDGIGDFARPKGVALDSEEHIYVTDALFDVIQVFDKQGQILLAFGGSGRGFGSFSLPTGLAIDVKDRIYVVDSGNKRVQVFQYLR
ncbi:MAG: 6-bladed beta-propeller [Ignavibacteriae bacterium]|nr:6-bladed beta-propeller [Ignavibacteriota bacterium]